MNDESILALVVLEEVRDNVSSGKAPAFYVTTKKEQERVALLVSRIIKAMVHDLENGVYILVKH